jgi:hypothetical protein
VKSRKGILSKVVASVMRGHAPGERSRPLTSRPLTKRRALLIMTVLVCLAVVMTLSAAWLRTIMIEHRHTSAAALGVQAEFLALSGFERAMAQVAADSNFPGETWRLDASMLGGQDGATVTIGVAAPPDHPNQRRITVVAEFPDEGPHRARRTYESTIELDNKGQAS